MHDDLRQALPALFPSVRADWEGLIRIPSVSAPGFDPAPLRTSAERVASLLEAAGARATRLLETGGAPPAVYGGLPATAGAPTVLLYAHHDVQPAGDASRWATPPFEPTERDGRVYGRGASDDKAGIAVHLAALRAHGGRPPVGVKVLIEGEEEIGSPTLPAFLARHQDLLAADAIVIADSSNVRAGQPSLTTSLRGLVDCVVEVRTLEDAVHSGLFGGPAPDALVALARLLATLHDTDGRPAVPGLVADERAAYAMSEAQYREEAGTVPGLTLLGQGPLASRLWTQPAIDVLAIDAPPVREAINQVVPVARAKVSVRLAPGDDPVRARDALAAHLESHAPWGAQVTVQRGAAAAPFALDTSGPAYTAYRAAFQAAWGRESIDAGLGGSIPFVAAFSAAYPRASILLTGVGDPTSRIHGPNENQRLDELERGCLAEAIALRLLGAAGR